MKWLLPAAALAALGLSISAWDYYRHPSFERRVRQVESLTGPQNAALLIGDSITQASNLDDLCGLPVINAGIAGSRVQDWTSLAPTLVDRLHPKIVIYALGVNDADPVLPFDVARWAETYGRLRRGGYVLGVLPTHMAGFSNQRIAQMNAALKGPNYIPPFPTDGLTIDGVHLNWRGKKRWNQQLRSICRK